MKAMQLKSNRLLLTGAVISVLLTALALRAEDINTVELIKRLERRIEELEQKVKTLERTVPDSQRGTNAQTEQRLEAVEQQAKSLERSQLEESAAIEARARQAPKITIGDQGFSFASQDDNFALRLKGVLQVDSRTFFNDAGIVGNDGFLLRRARPILEGTVLRDFDFLLVPDFAGSTPQIFDAYLNYRYSPELQLQAGKFKAPVGLEQLQLDRDILFNERALPTDLVPNRDLGIELHGDLFKGAVSYAAGIFNGVGDARLSNNASFQDDKSFAGRLFFQPFKPTSLRPLRGFGFGLSGSFVSEQAPNTSALPATTGGSLPGFFTVGQEQFFAYNPANKAVVVASGDHWRLSPQGYYYWGPLSFLGEYVISDQRVSTTVVGPPRSAYLEHTAWQVALGYVLTGEDAAFAGGVAPRHPFNPLGGGWGAWQLLARCSELDVDRRAFGLFADAASSARSAQELSLGLNWYLNRNVRAGTSFSHTTFDGGGAGATAPGLVTRRDENVLFTRLQLAF